MEVFRKHKINPMSGCLPALITMPLFSAFFFMLPSAAELRFQSFLWAFDLSAPDTVGHLPGIGLPINIFPLLAAGAMMLQMRLVPTPTADNMQTKMMKWGMPIFLLFIWYSFSCALALYSTVNNLFAAGQQLVINRMRDTGDPAAATAPATVPGGKRPMKNVTPARKKGPRT
jgi:YidC/Oxa1 family membrane protein insertase